MESSTLGSCSTSFWSSKWPKKVMRIVQSHSYRQKKSSSSHLEFLQLAPGFAKKTWWNIKKNNIPIIIYSIIFIYSYGRTYAGDDNILMKLLQSPEFAMVSGLPCRDLLLWEAIVPFWVNSKVRKYWWQTMWQTTEDHDSNAWYLCTR